MLNWDNTGVTVELGEIVASGVNIWDFDYPVPAETVHYNGKTAKVPFDKETFQQKIIDHYRFRQIGQETVGRWLHYFRTRIREIMPYYVQLYEFEAKWFYVDDPLESYNLTETYSGKDVLDAEGGSHLSNRGTLETKRIADNTNDIDQNSTKKFSDTPQGSIDNLDSYLTEATRDNGKTTNKMVVDETDTVTDLTGNDTVYTQDHTTTKDYTITRKGNIGVQPLGGEVKNIRDAFINIDQMVIHDLKDLFLQVY